MAASGLDQESCDIVPDSWLGIDLTISIRTAHWWIPFGTPVKLLRIGARGYVVRLVPPLDDVPERIYVPGLDSLLWDAPDPQLADGWFVYKSTFKKMWHRDYAPKLRPVQERLEKLCAPPSLQVLADAESFERHLERRHSTFEELRRDRDSYWMEAREKTREASGWRGPDPRQVGDTPL